MSFQDKARPIATSTPSFMTKATPVAAPAPVQAPVQQETPTKLWDTSGFKAGFTGAAKSLGKTAMGIGVLGRGIQKGVGNIFGADTQPTGMFDKGSQANIKATEFLKPKNKAEGAAVLGADLTQYVLPGSAASKATKTMSIVPRTLLRATPDVAVQALQSQGDVGSTATVGAASVAANLLTPGVNSGMIRKAMSTIAPGYISDIGTGLTGARGEDRRGAAAFIPGIGTAIGAGLAVGQGAVKVASNIRHPEVRTIEKRGKTLNTIINTYSKVNDAVKMADSKMAGSKMADGSDMNVRKILSETNLLNGAVDENGKVSKGLALQNFDNFISPYEARVREEIQKEARTIPIQQLAREVDDFATKSRLESGAYEDMLSNLTKDFNGLQAKYGDNIPVEALHDTKIFRNTHANYMDTGANESSKEAARFFKEQVEKNVGGIDVKAFNAELSKFYSLKEVIEVLDKTRVEGGRLGKHFATVVGTGIGGMFGGAGGAFGGAIIAPKIKGEMMRRAFGGLLSPGLEATPALKETSAGRTGTAAIPDLIIPKKPSNGLNLDLGKSQGTSVVGAKTGVIPVKEVLEKKLPKTTVLEKKGDYLYHGTNETVLDNIKKEGLKPGMRGQLSMSITEDYAKTFAREGKTPTGKTESVLLRVKSDTLADKTSIKRVDGKQRPLPDQQNELLTKEIIAPEQLEIFKDGKWQPLVGKTKIVMPASIIGTKTGEISEFINPINKKIWDDNKIPYEWATYTTAQKNQYLKSLEDFRSNKTSELSETKTNSNIVTKVKDRDTSLTGKGAEIQEASIAKYEADPQKMVDDYLKENGKIINTDEARKLFNDVGYNGANSASVHEAASAVSKSAWREALSKNKGEWATLFAGGSGTGKTSVAQKASGEIIGNSSAVLDGNLSKMSSALERIKEAKAAGKKVALTYVYREATDAWINGVISRMLRNPKEKGRVVPLSTFLENHEGSYNVTKELLKNKDVDNTKLIDNSFGVGKHKYLDVDKFNRIVYNTEALRSKLLAVTKKLYDNKTITKVQYNSLIK